MVVCRGPHVSQSEAPMAYGPRITLDGSEYDLLIARDAELDCPRAMAVPTDALVWLCDRVSIEEGRERRLDGVRLVERRVDGVWVDR